VGFRQTAGLNGGYKRYELHRLGRTKTYCSRPKTVGTCFQHPEGEYLFTASLGFQKLIAFFVVYIDFVIAGFE